MVSPPRRYFIVLSQLLACLLNHSLLLFCRDSNVSNIASGFIYNSPSNGIVRVDEAFDSTFASSLFDYGNVTEEGGVSNRLWSLSPAITSPAECFSDFVAPAFPLISPDILVTNGAIYAGTTYDAFAGEVALVSSIRDNILHENECQSR